MYFFQKYTELSVRQHNELRTRQFLMTYHLMGTSGKASDAIVGHPARYPLRLRPIVSDKCSEIFALNDGH